MPPPVPGLKRLAPGRVNHRGGQSAQERAIPGQADPDFPKVDQVSWWDESLAPRPPGERPAGAETLPAGYMEFEEASA